MKSPYLDDAPLYRSLVKYAGIKPVRFHMPGHKGCEESPLFPVFGKSLGLDVTELPETDNLFEDEGAILEAERLAAKVYGARETLFSAGGSTLCIQAMLRLVSGGGGRVICARNVHRAAVNAMALLGLEPYWVWPRPFMESGLPGAVAPEDIEKAAEACPDAAAVFLTSPDYYGVMSDIAGISRVCRRHGIPLLVDNAHGAHLISLPGTLHPLALGADLCCDSAHKTLPALTGGAFLHIGSARFTRRDAKDAMMLFGSTSPSYFIMLSLDIARAWLACEGRAAFLSLCEKVKYVRAQCQSLGFKSPRNARFDPVRITIDTASAGLSGDAASLRLRQHGISPEMSDARHLVLIPTPFNSARDFTALIAALKTLPVSSPLPLSDAMAERPRRALTLREALTSFSETVDTACAAGRIAAEAKCPCPPGVPVVMPGELISDNASAYLKNCGVLKIKVVQ